MSTTITATSDGLSGELGVNGVTALRASSANNIVTGVAPYTLVGNGPAFSAYMSSALVTGSGADQILYMNTERFDTHSCFDTATYTFTPTVAGYYQVNVSAWINGTTVSSTVTVGIKKGGVVFESATGLYNGYGGASYSGIIQMNGTTDTLQAYGRHQVGSNQSFQSGAVFSACLVRAA